MLYTAFLIGLLGSFHCLGMCGPIVLALPGGYGSLGGLVASRISYNLGRVFMYGCMGLLFGFMGRGFVLAGLQNAVSILSGSIIVLLALLNLIGRSQQLFAHRIYEKFYHFFKQLFQPLVEKKSFLSMWGIGILNGLLPCGFVYIGLAGAIETGSAETGFWFMIFFGLGTLPIMLGAGLLGVWVTQPFRTRLRRVLPFTGIALGVLFILRGLNLDIPYVSPILQQGKIQCPACKGK